MRLSVRFAAALLVAALGAAWSAPALACACDKEARIKKYGTLKLVQQAAPPPVAVPPQTPIPGS